MAPSPTLADFVAEFGGGCEKPVEVCHAGADNNEFEQSVSRRKSMRYSGPSRGDEGSTNGSGGGGPGKGPAVDGTQALKSADSPRAELKDAALNRTAETLAASETGHTSKPEASRMHDSKPTTSGQRRRLCCSCGELIGVVVILCTIAFLLFSLEEAKPQPVSLIGEGQPAKLSEKLAWDLSSSTGYQSRISAAKSLTGASQMVELATVMPHLTTARRQLEMIDKNEEAVYKTLFQTLPTLCAGARSNDLEQAVVNAQALVYHGQSLAVELGAGILDEYDRAISMLHQIVRAIDLEDNSIRGKMQAHDADREQTGHGNVWRFWLASRSSEEPYIAWENQRRLHEKISRDVIAAEGILEEKRRPWLGVRLSLVSMVALLERLGQNDEEGPLSHDVREISLKGVKGELQKVALHLGVGNQ